MFAVLRALTGSVASAHLCYGRPLEKPKSCTPGLVGFRMTKTGVSGQARSRFETEILAGGHLRAVLPIVAELADEVERAGDENGVARGGRVQSLFEGPFRFR